MKTTAIIAKDHSDFKEYLRRNLSLKRRFVFIDSIEKTQGSEFSEVIITDNVEKNGIFVELYNACLLRIR